MRRIEAGPAAFNVDDDKETFWDRLEAGRWEPETLAALAGLIGPATTLIDIGAWVGPVTLLGAALGAEVLAYEPDPRAFALLRGNVAANPLLSSRIRLHECAIAARAGTLRFGSPRKQGDSMGSVLMADNAAATWQAEAVTPSDVASLVLDARSIVLKIDVEGAEYALLEHIAPLLERPVEACIIAFHPRILAQTGVDAARIDRMTKAAERIFAGYDARLLEAGRPSRTIPRHVNATLLFERAKARLPRANTSANGEP